eukprot:SAG22_NODE_1318_length_4763_cov_18.825472_2_plen_122_part_00
MSDKKISKKGMKKYVIEGTFTSWEIYEIKESLYYKSELERTDDCWWLHKVDDKDEIERKEKECDALFNLSNRVKGIAYRKTTKRQLTDDLKKIKDIVSALAPGWNPKDVINNIKQITYKYA